MTKNQIMSPAPLNAQIFCRLKVKLVGLRRRAFTAKRFIKRKKHQSSKRRIFIYLVLDFSSADDCSDDVGCDGWLDSAGMQSLGHALGFVLSNLSQTLSPHRPTSPVGGFGPGAAVGLVFQNKISADAGNN